MIWKKKWSPWQSTSAAANTISCNGQLLRISSQAGCQQLDCSCGSGLTIASGINQSLCGSVAGGFRHQCMKQMAEFDMVAGAERRTTFQAPANQ